MTPLRCRTVVVTTLLLALLAGSLRFARLGSWSFGNDETATHVETRALLADEEPLAAAHPDAFLGTQLGRLPRVIPLGYVLLHTGHELFGTDEWGCRVMTALLGTLCVVTVYLGLLAVLGQSVALASALLTAVWYEHLFHSQNHRFYIVAALFAAWCMLFGALALQRRSVLFMVLACLAAGAAIASHTLQGVLFVGLGGAIVGSAVVLRQPLAWRLLGVVLLAGATALGVLVVYLLPLLEGWNRGESWGYGVVQSLQGAVAQLGWPTLLLAVPGSVALWQRERTQAVYWLSFAGVWLLASVAFPLAIVHYVSYVFPFALSVVVLAGAFVATVYESLQERCASLARAWLLLVPLLNLPALYSHYQDGGRHDYRGAAQYLERHWQAGDRLAAVSSGLLAGYSPVCAGALPLPDDPIAMLVRESQKQGRLWIVVTSGRAGLPEPLHGWLGRHARRQEVLCKRRLDAYDYRIEIYRVDVP